MNVIQHRKFEIYATGSMYDPELQEKIENLGFTDVTVKSIVPQKKLRDLLGNENFSGLSDDCRSVILCLEDYQPYHDDLLDALDTDNTLELFDSLAVVLNRHLNEFQSNLLLQKLVEDTLTAYEERCNRVCKSKREYGDR